MTRHLLDQHCDQASIELLEMLRGVGFLASSGDPSFLRHLHAQVTVQVDRDGYTVEFPASGHTRRIVLPVHTDLPTVAGVAARLAAGDQNCECGQPGRLTEDPFSADVYDNHRLVVLCPQCVAARHDEI